MNVMDFDIVNQQLAKNGIEKVKAKAAGPAQHADQDEALKEACAGFEAILLQTMLKSMRQSLPGDAVFKDSNATDIFKSMQDQYLADHLARGRSSTGLKEFLYEQLKDSV